MLKGNGFTRDNDDERRERLVLFFVNIGGFAVEFGLGNGVNGHDNDRKSEQKRHCDESQRRSNLAQCKEIAALPSVARNESEKEE